MATLPIFAATWPRNWVPVAHVVRLGSGERAMRIGTFPVGISRDFTRLARRALKTAFVQEVIASVPALMIGVDRLDYPRASVFGWKPMSVSWRPS